MPGGYYMIMRPPSVPLITIDPYFSVWSPCDNLYDEDCEHWTGSPNKIKGIVAIDNEEYRFMGDGNINCISQTKFDMSALITQYTFKNDKIELNLDFYTPLFPDDLYRLSRPVSYLNIKYKSIDKLNHDVSVKISVSEEICVNKKGDKPVFAELVSHSSMKSAKMGCKDQDILSRSGDDIRIDWGYFYLSVSENNNVSICESDNDIFVSANINLKENVSETVLFSYDDIYSLNYFGTKVPAFWKKSNDSIINAIEEAYSEREAIFDKCVSVGEKLYKEASDFGGDEYAELLSLAFRQVIAAHKIATDNDGEVIFISKECFSNGCAATVDVTYPSSPFFLLYNTELLKGMLRPIFKFAESSDWEFDFAPHDVGQYPLILGQVYGTNHIEDGKYKDYQMPVEECGNMLIMMANIVFKDGNTEFFDKYQSILASWVKYLIEYGMDPENQLCTDDFAGHLAHNCNLSLKAIMGIQGYGMVLKIKNDPDASYYLTKAAEMAENWVKMSANTDGSFRLTFDRPDTFSMKYNMIWDKIWHTGLFAPCVYNSEFSSNLKHINAYGMPLDNRKDYTKSDWLVWTACLAPTKDDFCKFIYPLWNCYNVTPSRVPLTDWYDTVTSLVVGFRHRSVQGGLFIGLLKF